MPTQIDFTIKKDGTGDYTSIKSFVLANQKNLVAADESHFVTIYGAGWDEVTPLSESFIDFNNYTTDSTRNITFYVRTEDRHDFTAGTGFVFTVPTSFGFVLRSKNIILDGFEISNTSNTNNLFDTSANAKLTNCLVHDVDYAQFAGDGEKNIHYNYASRGGFTNTFYNGGTLKNITCIQLLTEGGFTGDIGIANANCTNVVLYTDKPTGSFTNFFNCSGDYNAVNKSGEGVPGANSFDTVLLTDFVDFTNDNYISKLGGQLESSGEGGTFIGAALQAAPSGEYDLVINGNLPFLTGGLTLTKATPEYNTSISGTLPFISSSLNLSQTPSSVNVIVDGNIPFITSSLETTQTLPEYTTTITGDIPFIGSSITAVQTVPEYNASINGSLPFLTSDLTLTRAAPEEINVVVLGDLPFIGSSATVTQTVPEYDSTVSGNIPFLGSSLNLTQAGLAEFNAAVLGDMPFLSSSLTITQSIPEYDTSISGDLPFLGSTLALTQIVSGVSASIDGNIPFLSSSLSVSHEIPDYDVTISGNMPFVTSKLVLTQQDNNNNAEISGVLPFIGSSLDLSNQIPPPNDLSISGNIPFIAGNLFLVNREIEPVLTAGAARLTDTYNITYQTLTYTVINEV